MRLRIITRLTFALVAAALSAVALAACSSDPTPEPTAAPTAMSEPASTPTPTPEPTMEPLVVVTSIYPMQFFAERVGGERAEVFNLVPPGVEAHAFEPSPSDLRRIASADVIAMNGLAMEPWLDRALAALGDDVTAIIVETASEEGALPFSEEGHDDHGDEDEHGHGEDEEGHDEDEEHGHDEDEEGHDEDEEGHDEDEEHGHDEDEEGHDEDEEHGHDEDEEGHDEDEEHGHDEGEEGHDEDEEHGHDEDEHGHDEDEEGHDDHEDEHGHDEDEEGHDDHEDEHGHDDHGHGEFDPHLWNDPLLAITQAEIVAGALIQADPNGADFYRANLDALAADLRALHAEFESGLASCRHHEFITSHAAYGYLAARYGLEQAAIAGLSPDAEPTAGRLADLTDLIRETGISAVLVEPVLSGASESALAQEAGVQQLPIHALGSVTPDELAEHGDYIGLMRDTLASLRIALECA